MAAAALTLDWMRPYRAAFAARFQLMLQYRAAALAGFATQCWWGGLKVMIFAAFYGEEQEWDTAGWREMAGFSACVLRPLEWAGLIVETPDEQDGKQVHHVSKTPLWRSALKLKTDQLLTPALVN